MPFYFLLVLLLLPALAFVVVPYLRTNIKQHAQRRSETDTNTNVELYAVRLKELEQELKAEHILPSEFEQLKDELGISLLVDTRLVSSVHTNVSPLKKRSHVVFAVSSALVIVVFSWLLYAKLGAWPEVEIQIAARVLEQKNTPPEELQALVELLNNRLIDDPQDSNTWYLLGHTHMKQGSFRQSASAFERLRALVGADVNIDTSLVQARYMAEDGNISDVNRLAMKNILKRAPHQTLILEILAIEAFQNRDAAAAIAYLQQGLAGGLRGERAESFRSGIKRAQGMRREMAIEMGAEVAGGATAAGTGTLPAGADLNARQSSVSARIVIQVSIDPTIQAAPETAVFVFAREQGGMPMPLAVKRLSVGELPIEIVFTDADAMVKSRLLSQFNLIELVARLSYSGQPTLQPGDVESRVGDVVVAQLEAPIILRLEP